ncbi:MAG: hypothetical protein AAGF46_07830, partial [Pseudomonadota bacterium]
MTLKTLPRIPALAALCLLSPLALADDDGERKPRAKRGPPAVALAACEGQVELAACAFVGRQGETVTGQCAVVPRTETT